jgi:hypothetical protein
MTDHTGITKTLRAEEIFEPWELEGKARRDCLSHRAQVLQPLAYLSLILGGLSFCLPLASLPGIILGFITSIVCSNDLVAICSGPMDHNGYHKTLKALGDARSGMILCGFALFGWGILIGLAIIRHYLLSFRG